MAEYVEKNLERLLPVFEQLKAIELLSDGEMKEFVKRLRQYEYRLCKREKKPTDFFKYCEYLNDFLRLIQIRRDAMQNNGLTNEIEQPLKWKVAELYRLATERFKKLGYFQKELEFLKWARLYGAASKCYTKMLQTHGNDPTLHEQAARWEFFENRSAENARSILQLALRKFPTSLNLWVAFFDVELHYVRTLAERRGFLVKKDVKEELESDIEPEKKKKKRQLITPAALDDIPDAVFQFKLAEIVLNQALDALSQEQHSKLLYRMWRSAYSLLPLTEKVEKLVYEKLWSGEDTSEEAYLCRILKEHHEDASFYTQYDKAIAEKDTERMTRLYMEFCEDRIKLGDPFASMKLIDLLNQLHKSGKATEDDYKRLLEIWDSTDDDEKIEEFLEVGLKKAPKSVLFWEHLLGIKMKKLVSQSNEAEKSELIRLFEDAIEKVSPLESFPIWTQFIDLTISISKSPTKVDKIFEKAILVTPTAVSSQIKSIRLKYLIEVYPENIQLFHDEYQKLAKVQPNTEKFHLDFAEMELSRPDPDLPLVHKAFNNAIAESGRESLECWLEYARFLIRNQPEKVGALNSRALTSIPAELTDEFYERWTKLVQDMS